MSVLRPKYQLDHGEVEGGRVTIPPEEFTRLTGQRYPYPRLGTRAPNSNPGPLAPKYTTDSLAAPPSSGTVTAPRIRAGLMPKYQAGDGNPIAPHYLLDHPEVQGVMPTDIYVRLTGQRTHAWTPELLGGAPQVARVPVTQAPTLAFDAGSFIIGAIAGGLLTIGFVYGIIPALAEWGAAEIKKRY